MNIKLCPESYISSLCSNHCIGHGYKDALDLDFGCLFPKIFEVKMQEKVLFAMWTLFQPKRKNKMQQYEQKSVVFYASERKGATRHSSALSLIFNPDYLMAEQRINNSKWTQQEV